METQNHLAYVGELVRGRARHAPTLIWGPPRGPRWQRHWLARGGGLQSARRGPSGGRGGGADVASKLGGTRLVLLPTDDGRGTGGLHIPETPSPGQCGDPAYHCMCSMQVVDITPMKHRLTSITSIRVVQQKHRRSTVCL
jgi:hypothetical protein